MKKFIEPLVQSMRASWKPQDSRTPWEWCEENVTVDNTSPFQGKWRSATSPWVKELMEVAADRRVTKISVRCAAQSSKTMTIACLLCYSICEDPGPTMYVMSNQVDAEDFVRDRFAPTIRMCQPAAKEMIRETKSSFTFTTMPLYFVGAGSTGKLQGKPMKRLFLDEVRNWPKGALATVEERVTAFTKAGSQVFMISTPGNENDAVDAEFQKGDQRTFHFPCPKCGVVQQLKMSQLKWDTNETTRAGGRYNFDKLTETIRYECENTACRHSIRDTPAERKMICRTGSFVKMNPAAPKNHISFTWNALLPWWVSWGDLVEKFLNARSAIRAGDLKPMFTFVTEKLGEPWKDQLGVIEDFGFIEARKQDYNLGFLAPGATGDGEKWPEEKTRFIAADRGESGGEHYWWVVRACGANGKSRLVGYGKAFTLAELEEKRKEYGVPVKNAMLDTGWKAGECYRFCISTGWKAFKAEPNAEFFMHRQQTGPNTWRMIRRVWERTFVDPFLKQRGPTKPMPLFRYADRWTQDLLMEQMTGLSGEWTISKYTEREYMQQIGGEVRKEETDPKGRIRAYYKRIGANHWRDCEKTIRLATIISKLTCEPLPDQPKHEQVK